MTPNTVDSGARILALFPELHGVGGIQEASRLTAAALTEIASHPRAALDFLSLNDPPGPQNFSSFNGNIAFSGFGRAKPRFVFSAIAAVRAGAQIVLALHPNLALPAAQLKLFQPNLKLAVFSHGVEVWRRLPLLRRRAFLTADVFVAPSRYTLEQIVTVQGAPRNSVRRVAWPLSPNVQRIAVGREPLTPPRGFPTGLVLLTVARLISTEKYKGVDQLIRAIAQLAPKFPTLNLAVVGSGDDLPRHRALAVELGVPSRIHFLEARSPAELAACYSKCDIFALPSTGEGFGFVFLEAMAFSRPVLGVAAGGVTDIIEHGKTGLLVPPNDFDTLVCSLEGLLSNESLRTELGRNAAESVASKYQFQNFCRDLEQVLLDCGLAPRQSR